MSTAITPFKTHCSKSFEAELLLCFTEEITSYGLEQHENEYMMTEGSVLESSKVFELHSNQSL